MEIEEAIARINALKREAGDFIFKAAMRRINSPKVDPGRGKKRPFPFSVVFKAAESQNWTCPVCGHELKKNRYSIHGDHINPNKTVGLNSPENCQALHVKCNLEKGPKSMFEVSKTSGRTILDQLNRT